MFRRRKENILVIKTDSLAGFVAAEPFFEALRTTYSQASISLLTTSSLQRIARASPYFDQVAGIANFRDPEAKNEFIKQLKSAKFDQVYDLAVNDISKKLFSAMGPFRPKWKSALIPAKRKGEIRNRRMLPDINHLMQENGFQNFRRLPDLNWALSARKDSANMKPSWYGISGAFGLLLPSEENDSRWPASGYAGLATLMADRGYMPVLAGPKSLHNFGDEIADRAPQLVDLTGKTDHLQLAALAHEAAFFVSDGAEEMCLAMSVGCEGVVVTNAGGEYNDSIGRHVVALVSEDGVACVEPPFVWHTLGNMGLTGTDQNLRQSASAH